MQKLFKNATLIDLDKGKGLLNDLLIENGKIIKIGNIKNYNCQCIDLCGDFVLPNFVNVFCDSIKAFEKTYKKHIKKIDLLQNLMLIKNLLAGAIFFDSSKESCTILENVEEKSEKELSYLSDYVAKNKSKLFLKVGLSLQELGTIDNIYKKALSQLLEHFGFLATDPILVGGNCFEKDDFQLFSQYCNNFCLTVGEDGKSGRRPVNLLTLKDFNVALGSGYSFEIDFFAFMRQILLTQRGLFEDETLFTEQEVLKMATINGAKMLIGKGNDLKVGADANFIVINKGLSLYDDIFKTLVWEKSKKDIKMTILKGEIAQKSGEIVGKNDLNYDIILKEICLQGENNDD